MINSKDFLLGLGLGAVGASILMGTIQLAYGDLPAVAFYNETPYGAHIKMRCFETGVHWEEFVLEPNGHKKVLLDC